MSVPDCFVADGYERAYRANFAVISAELEELYAERLKVATFWERRRIRQEMKRELATRMDRIAPPDALY